MVEVGEADKKKTRKKGEREPRKRRVAVKKEKTGGAREEEAVRRTEGRGRGQREKGEVRVDILEGGRGKVVREDTSVHLDRRRQ